jgi:hypothetical protein
MKRPRRRSDKDLHDLWVDRQVAHCHRHELLVACRLLGPFLAPPFDDEEKMKSFRRGLALIDEVLSDMRRSGEKVFLLESPETETTTGNLNKALPGREIQPMIGNHLRETGTDE